MKIAISTAGITLDAQVDPRFGRANHFIIYDLELDKFHVKSNEKNLYAAQGAGIQAAQYLCDQNINCVITGNCGPKAYQTLRASEIDVYICKEPYTVEEAITMYKKGELESIDKANVAGHWI